MKSAYRNLILRTKLYKPIVRDDYVSRKRIVDKLENNRSDHVTLIVAAAGYGKSIIASEWMDHTNAKHCWISLDEEFNDLRIFLLYLVSAVESVIPESLPELSKLLGATELPAEKTLSTYLINELEELEEELILVLDDYHFISSQQIHNLVDDLLRYFSPRCHLVIIARRDPPLDLNSLRSYGNVHDLRMSELSFDRNEAISLANNITSIQLSNERADNLLEWTEGWVVGLRLALLTMNKGKNVEKALEEIKGDKHCLTEFLLNEVFLPIEEDVRIILLAASLVERFNKDLLKEMVKNEFAKDKTSTVSLFGNLFDRFRESSLFIIPLDQEGKWFRYHHFIREFLLRQLEKFYSKKQISEFHIRASGYFNENELFEEAIRHALKAENIILAIQIIEKNKYITIDADQFGRLRRWLELLPDGTIENHLGLLLARAFLYDTVKDFTSMRNDLMIAENLIANSASNLKSQKQLLGEFHTVYSNLYFNEGNFEDAHKHSRKALQLLTAESAYLRDYALAYQAFSLSAVGKFEEGITILKDRLRQLPPSDSSSQLRNLITQSILYSLQGNLLEIMSLALQYHSLCIKDKLWVSFAYSTYYLSETCYQWNELDKAVAYAETLDGHFYAGRPSWVFQTLFTKAFSLQALGKTQELNHAVLDVVELARNIDQKLFHECTGAFEVELAIRQDNIGKALELSKKIDFESFLPLFFFYFPQLTFVKLLMNSGRQGDIDQAEKRLDQLISFGRSTHKIDLLIQALPLQSLLYDEKGKVELAVEKLKEALTLAEPGNFIRTFLDLGSPMEELLKKVHEEDLYNQYVSHLLSSFKDENARLDLIETKKQDLPTEAYSFTGDELTHKEINLLKLVAEGYQNKEIAEKLYLAPSTIKKSLFLIYQKLDVHNRTTAVAKAIKAGLLKPLDQLNQTGLL